MKPRDTVNMQGFYVVATLVPPFDFQNYYWVPLLAPGDPQEGEQTPSWPLRVRGRSQNTIAAYLPKIVAPWGLPPF